MFPLYDSTPRTRFPFINYLLILANVYVFFLQIASPDLESFTTRHAFIASAFNPLQINGYVRIFTALFLHGGFFHILSNMWFLHIFGDNVEDRLGHIPYLIFYLLAGFAATIGQYVLSAHSSIPMIGASGAISGVAGAYFVLYRHSTVRTLIPIFFFVDIIDLPVWFFLGYWFIIQVFSGIGSVVAFDVNQGGIAWFAHIAGFIFGYFAARRLKTSEIVASE